MQFCRSNCDEVMTKHSLADNSRFVYFNLGNIMYHSEPRQGGEGGMFTPYFVLQTIEMGERSGSC